MTDLKNMYLEINYMHFEDKKNQSQTFPRTWNTLVAAMLMHNKVVDFK